MQNQQSLTRKSCQRLKVKTDETLDFDSAEKKYIGMTDMLELYKSQSDRQDEIGRSKKLKVFK